MRKFFLFALLCTATAMMADDAVLVENFSGVGNVATGTYTWTGDVCTWSAFQTARRKQDTILTANQKQAIWMSVSNAGAAKVSTTNLEGGIKAVDFKYARFGKETTTAGRVLQLKVSVNTIEDQTPTYAGNAMKLGNGVNAAHETYSHAFNCAESDAQLSIENISSYTEDLTASGICRICVGDITITPYLLYTRKVGYTSASKPYINNALINNTDEGEIVYSVSENTIGATINPATGEVVAEEAGEVTVTASWGNVSTSYVLHVIPANYSIETFDDAVETTQTYATNGEVHTMGDICEWYTQLGGVKSMSDANYKSKFPSRYAIFRAPHQESEEVSYFQSDSIEGGIANLTFQANPTANEGTTNWDIRVFINDVQVGETFTDFGTAPQNEFKTITILDINVEGKFVIRFENHSTIDGAYTSGNKGRLAIDNIQWEGYEVPCEGDFGILVDGETYVAGEKNEAQTNYTEYIIEVSLLQNHTIQLYDNCTKAAFLPNGQDEGGYWFTVTDGVWSAPEDGKYTIYLKMYGYENNWIYTVRVDLPTDIENQAVKADVRKMVENGMVVIYRNGVRYNLQGVKY